MKKRNMQKSVIVDGYKGIMELDLSMYNESQRESVIQQHLQDIANYKKYQKDLQPHLRYENTIERIKRIHENEQLACQKRKLEDEKKKYKKYEEMIQLFANSSK
jgi:hypothetical protein